MSELQKIMYNGRTRARLPGHAAAACGGSPRARRVRSDAVGQVAIPNILEWAGPAIVVSIKPDLLDATLAARAQRGKALVFDPLGQWKQPSHTWSPLAAASSWNVALQTAQRMASAGETDTSTVKGGSFWSQAAEQRLAPLLYAAARTGRGMGEVVRWVYGQGGAELDRSCG
jgi:hypothetical protein